jgi:hypothetical protein
MQRQRTEQRKGKDKGMIAQGKRKDRGKGKDMMMDMIMIESCICPPFPF